MSSLEEFNNFISFYVRDKNISKEKLNEFKEFALTSSECAYIFARELIYFDYKITKEDIEELQEIAIKKRGYAFNFACLKHPHINVAKCLRTLCDDKEWCENIAEDYKNIPEEIQILIASKIDRPTKNITSSKAIDKWYNTYKMHLACE